MAITDYKLFPYGDMQTPADSSMALKLDSNIRRILRVLPPSRSSDDLAETVKYFKPRDPKYSEALAKLHEAVRNRETFDIQIPRVMVMQELPKPRDTFILVKGAYNVPADKVTSATLACLPPMPADLPRNRLGLARWLVSPDNPLTARVTVNRFWQQFFGTGLVKTPDDFGVQGAAPSHPELLDWLAREFIESGWNVKAMQRLIVTSAAYRQSSAVDPALFERDPQNRLLARGARFRLPSFVLRDQALAASGLLVEKLGGPPVKPYQPAGVWEEATFGQITYQPDHGESLYRRSVYTFWRRIVGPTEFFDAGARQTCTVKYSRTNSPLHALTTLNDTTYVEAARALAERVMTAPDRLCEQRIERAFRLVLARKPTARERQVLVTGFERLNAEYGADRPAAAALLAVGESKRDERLDPIEHAAYTGVCLTILNLDEAITKE